MKKVKKITAIILSIIIALMTLPLAEIVSVAIGSDSKSVLLNLLKNSTTDNVIEFLYDDYDADGKYEAFAVTSNNSIDLDWNCLDGCNIWFINSDGANIIKSNFGAKTNGEQIGNLYEAGNKKFISYKEYYATGDIAYFWYVKDGQLVYDSNASGCLCFFSYDEQNGWFVGCHSTYDMAPEGTGHTWKQYYFYFNNGLKEYGGIEISESKLCTIPGATEVVNQIKSIGNIQKIFARSNGIININYTVESDDSFINSNATLLLSKGNLELVRFNERDENELACSDQGGIYSSALIPRIATYPEDDSYLNSWFIELLSAEEAVEIYLNNKNVWMADLDYSPMNGYGYTFLDLDMDGILELVVTICDGSGRYSYNSYYTINKAEKTVVPIQYANSDEAYGEGFDYVYNNNYPKLLKNKEDNTFIYFGYDYIRSSSSEYENLYGSLIASNGELFYKNLFYTYHCDANWLDNTEDIDEFGYYENDTCVFLDETEYNKKVDEFYSKYDDLDLKWKFIEGSEFGNASSDQQRKLLTEAYNAFSYNGINLEASPDGMQIIVNNTNLTYHVDDYMCVAVCNIEDNIKYLPEKLSVKISDSSVAEIYGIYDYEDLPNQFKVIEEFKNYKLIMIKTLSVGSAMISITNGETGESRVIPVSVCEDKVAEFRANNINTHTYKCGWETDYYNGYCDGIWISDFLCEKADDNKGWNISMNLYNENYCCGVVEVFDANGKLITVYDVKKFESLTKSIYKTFKAGYTIIEDAVQGDSLSFRSDATAKHTKIENLYVPQDGHIRITADISMSKVCAINNGFDAIFTAISLAEDIKSIIVGIDNLSSENIQQIKSALFAKLLMQEEYLHIGEKFQKKMMKKTLKEVTPDIINEFTSEGIMDIEEMLVDMGWSLDGLLKTALGSGVGVAEGLFEKCTGPIGLVLKGMFLFQEVSDFISEMNDMCKQITGNTKFGCYTPAVDNPTGIFKDEYVTVDTGNNVPYETVLQSYRILNPERTVVVLNDFCAYDEYETYEVALYCDGVTIQPDGKVKVYISCPYEKAIVVRENADGTLERIECTVQNGMVEFEVDHFCRFLLINEDSKIEVLLGDVNNDGKVSVIDAKWVLQVIANTRVFDDTQIIAADVNGDKKISVVDAKCILRIVAGTRV